MFFNGKLGKLTVLFILGLFVLHAVATYTSLYWRILWFDTPMHFLGGFVVGLGAVWWMFFRDKFSLPKNLPWFYSLILILGVVALVGVLWEFYEFAVDRFITRKEYINLTQGGIIDNMKDLFMDLSGGLLVVLAFLHERKKHIGKQG
ncbi:TPA: hypothetical protein DEW47_01765 [Patescibacteria group bacterium]|nr:MAG: hypothetical protein UT71_C0009G0028 [Parcubacteria group bacterium GW2011_GWF2_40_10]KKR47459.1 MAG: hypothetical protein UT83_C0009G0025 [Parcubacteria group bacterium GW2011_GWA2_40_143]KKR59880.1 MAG: hypothetical protein UT97_C0009G0025 [Parcubacteria group bacterium GW2011_GWC2_40_31]KKR76120.1 MAG: hypothetical protein UU20_C0033G0007 [Parcubacteria group bacterium GW2011_GWE2_40_8]KKR80958.1 MAG: hypothetical protein UU28_C0030G0006 [Parcubacteria group bacterium GW2011_GWD2_40_